jgi:hypothetical protein
MLEKSGDILEAQKLVMAFCRLSAAAERLNPKTVSLSVAAFATLE